MPDAVFSQGFPEWFTSLQLEDSAFGAAYDSLSPIQRSWLKKTIALADDYSRRSPHGVGAGGMRAERETSSGILTECCRSLQRLVVLTDSSTGPARLAAAVTPALLAGVEYVAAVHVDSGHFAPATLTALELAGVENAVALEAEQLPQLFASIADGRSAVMDLRSPVAHAAPSALPASLRYWSPDFDQRLHVWWDKGDDWDLDLLMLMHGKDNIVLWGPDIPHPLLKHTPPPTFMEGDFSTFQMHAQGAVLLNNETASTIARQQPIPRLTLSPEFAGCWAWPGVSSLFFRISSLACLPGNLL